VVVYAGDRVVAEGRTDDQGRFVFDYPGAGPLRVVMSAGAGHRAEILLPADALTEALPPGNDGTGKAGSTSRLPTVLPPADHAGSVPVKDVLLGITFLLALAAFALSLRNARRLRERG
jgi:hypothetical protein